MGDRVLFTVKKQAVLSKDIYDVHNIDKAGFIMDAGAYSVLFKRAQRDQLEAGFNIGAGTAPALSKRSQRNQ